MFVTIFVFLFIICVKGFANIVHVVVGVVAFSGRFVVHCFTIVAFSCRIRCILWSSKHIFSMLRPVGCHLALH